MINDILYSITKILQSEFNFKVYIDSVEQGFVTPSFYVKCINFSNEKLLTNERTPYHNKNNLSFSITYFPNEEIDTVNEDINNKITEILELLELIKTDKFKMRLKGSKVIIVDKTLILTLNYSINTFKYLNELELDVMDNLIDNLELKN